MQRPPLTLVPTGTPVRAIDTASARAVQTNSRAMTLLELCAVSKRYGATTALDSVSLTLVAGKQDRNCRPLGLG